MSKATVVGAVAGADVVGAVDVAGGHVVGAVCVAGADADAVEAIVVPIGEVAVDAEVVVAECVVEAAVVVNTDVDADPGAPFLVAVSVSRVAVAGEEVEAECAMEAAVVGTVDRAGAIAEAGTEDAEGNSPLVLVATVPTTPNGAAESKEHAGAEVVEDEVLVVVTAGADLVVEGAVLIPVKDGGLGPATVDETAAVAGTFVPSTGRVKDAIVLVAVTVTVESAKAA